MKIVDVRIHKLIVPMQAHTVHSSTIDDKLCAADAQSGRSLNFWEFPKWIVELEAGNGLIGIGEPRRGDIQALLQEGASLLHGKHMSEIYPARLPIPHDESYESFVVYEAFEMAWLDLLGKHFKVPVWYLLGGKQIDRVPIDFWMGRMTPEDTAARIEVAKSMGFHGVKMKCTWGDPICERVEAVRKVAPDFSIVLDANERFETLDRAIEVGRSLENFGNVILESPLPQDRLDWYVQLRRAIPQRVALHLTSLDELCPAIQRQAADCYNLLGPLFRFTQWASLATGSGCAVWRGTGVDLGIRDASSVHAAAVAGCQLPSDIVGHLLREDDLIKHAIPFEDGCLTVPNAPGLGVELDYEALRYYRVN